VAAISLPATATTLGSSRETFKQQRGKYGQEIAFIFHHPGILMTSGIEAVQYFAYGCLETFLPIYLNEKLGYPAWKIGLLFTAQILAATFTKPIMGRLSDRYGRIPMIVSGLVLGGVITGIMLLSSSYLVFLVLIAIFGLGLATVTASTSALVADLSRAQGRGGAMGVLSSIMDIGHSTGPMVAGALIGAYSYRTAFGVVGISLVVIGIIYWLTMYRFNNQGENKQIGNVI